MTLPDYRIQTPAVAARFAKIRERPVVLRVENLGREFPGDKGPVVALRDVSFEVHRREFVCVIGPSGCGKSTLIRMIAGLDEQTSGRLLVDDREVCGPGPDRGMVFQGYTLFPWLTVQRNVMFGLEMKGAASQEAEAEARQWIDLVGLAKFAHSYPAQLSGGMKQRTAIARALAANPRILLMDEPFGALDAQTRAQMQAHLLEIWRNVDVTILFITHDLDEAIFLADRILVLKANPGEVQEVIEVSVPRPRRLDQLNSPEFLATRRRLDELIHPKSALHEQEHLPIVRLTQVGDDVE
ncbi:ABC-type nitrate/sulfonate/bicarbonate transport system, ATPase component [Opitutaceae bacterium TAV1]|nr:ABC-type nitrate/sulfonate/bicarbonate transport system, ATPase component [Opitutaceae bacterium TAV1]